MKLFTWRISIIMTFCIPLFFSCTSDLELPPPPGSFEQGSSSSFSSSSSSGTSSSSSSFVFCQIESNCILLPEANCIYPGSIVPSCGLTCDISSHIVYQGVAINPPPVVRCNGVEVSRDIIWTPENLIFTSADADFQSVSAKVPNCNNATANCGSVIVF